MFPRWSSGLPSNSWGAGLSPGQGMPWDQKTKDKTEAMKKKKKKKKQCFSKLNKDLEIVHIKNK